MSAAPAVRVGEQQITVRAVVLASADSALRQRLQEELRQLRWSVFEADGGALAMGMVEAELPEAMLVDAWLPDLEAGEFTSQMAALYPAMDVLRMDGTAPRGPAGLKSSRRHELLHAIRESQEAYPDEHEVASAPVHTSKTPERAVTPAAAPIIAALPGLVGSNPAMLELGRMIRLVAPRGATVLIEGETGTGKEVVAKAVHRLSARAGKPFVVLNCAAIPESLLEAELFGHTRGAFTGAVQSRMGRIETADGGTLFLDEIGEMPLALQSKMLRFLECGELQRVGDNETVRVDVRIIAATHQPLEQRSEERLFRLDLYHRLAVFPVEVPPLRERLEDLPALIEHFLSQMGRESPVKTIAAEAVDCLRKYSWPGNVRELMHVLERAAILASDASEIGQEHIRLRRATVR